jgi:hypothetical protein
MSDTTTGWLRDQAELRRLTQRYARAIDDRDFAELASLFDPDGVVDGARGTSAVPAYLEGLRTAERVFPTSMHVLGDPLISLDPGADEGRLDTYAVVYQLRAEGSPDADLVLGIRYLDDVHRLEDRWVIRHRRALTLWRRSWPSPGA